MEHEEGQVVGQPPAWAQAGDGGTAAVLHGMLTTFSEALGGLDRRLAAIEAAVRDASDAAPSGEGDSSSLQRLLVAVEGRQAGLDLLLDTVRALAASLEGMAVRIEQGREEMAAARTTGPPGTDALAVRVEEVSEAVASVRSLLEAHMEDTAHSLGRRASQAGRRLASDLGLRPRPRR